MKKSELIALLDQIPGDPELYLPGYENGWDSIDRVSTWSMARRPLTNLPYYEGEYVLLDGYGPYATAEPIGLGACLFSLRRTGGL